MSQSRHFAWYAMKGLVPALMALGVVPPLPAHAVPVPYGITVQLEGTSVADRPELSGSVVEDVDRPFSLHWPGGRVLTGQIEDRIIRESSTGNLDFYYRIETDERFETTRLFIARTTYPSSVTTDVDFRSDGSGGAAPSSAHRSPNGLIVTTDFSNPTLSHGPAGSTRFVFIHTNAKEYSYGGVTEIYTADGIRTKIVLFQPQLHSVPGVAAP